MKTLLLGLFLYTVQQVCVGQGLHSQDSLLLVLPPNGCNTVVSNPERIKRITLGDCKCLTDEFLLQFRNLRHLSIDCIYANTDTLPSLKVFRQLITFDATNTVFHSVLPALDSALYLESLSLKHLRLTNASFNLHRFQNLREFYCESCIIAVLLIPSRMCRLHLTGCDIDNIFLLERERMNE